VGAKDLLYNNGLPFNGDLAENLDRLIDRVNSGKASVLIIEGGVGEGKTTIAVEVLDYINSKYNLPPIDLIDRPQLAMGGAEFMQKLRVCHEKKLPVVAYDEAGDFSRRGSLTQFNSMLNRTFETFRAFRILVVIILPNFNVLDQNLFDNKIPRLMISLKSRGSSYGSYGGYSLYRMALLRSYMQKMRIKNYAYSLVRPNFRGHFKNLPINRCRDLDQISTSNKLAILAKSEVKVEGLLTYPELAAKLLKSISWVRAKVSELKLKENRIIRQVKYFGPETLGRLSDHLEVMSENPKPKRNGPPKSIMKDLV